ncbi:hypothetical protein NC653_015152 [Populus alba x Populus x berolinensis]|uniref:ADF-H domain-containing protein n=1 Tax=Populus alba x Populus x berolinensis TaxID=444605 RepID=A0AAD6QZ67_9ROSI|nr:hypothetical protein NC653_015152 [Populus alba x Populus x berolinensis]
MEVLVVEKTGEPAESYEDFAASLPDNDCRYACLLQPLESVLRVLYATSKERFRRELNGIHYGYSSAY